MTRYIKKSLCCLMITLILLSAVTPALALSVKVKVNSSSARMYAKTSTSSKNVAMKKGLTLTLTGMSGNWARVKYKNITGYCALKYLTTTKRYAGYISKSTYAYKKPSTSSTKAKVSVNTKVYVIGKEGGYYRVQNSSGSVTCYVKASCVSTKKVAQKSTAATYKAKVVKLNWSTSGKNVLKKNCYGYIYDIKSGKTIRIKRMGGSNHADVEPVTKTDTAKLKAMSGGSYSWDSRPVILIANGKFVACAINTMPHGAQTITNNGYKGQFCLHMVGSTTHGSEEVNANHQSAIKQAYKWAH